MSSPVRDYHLHGPGRPRAASRSTSGTAPRMSSDSFAMPSTPLSSSMPRSSSVSLHTPPQFQPRIVRGTVPPSPVSSLNTSNNGTNGSPSSSRAGIDRRRRGSASATVLTANASSSTGAPSSSTNSGSSRHGHSMSLGSTSMLHQHLKASSQASGVPGSPSQHLGAGAAHGASSYSEASAAFISFPLPAYLEQTGLKRYLQITPYPYSNNSSYSSGHAGSSTTSSSSARRNSRSSFSSTMHHHPSVGVPMSFHGGSFMGAAAAMTARQSAAMLISDEESEDSDGERRPPQPSRRRASTTASNANGLGQTEQPFQEEFIQLPTKWNDEDRSTHLHISPDGREVSFSGAVSSGDRDAAAVRANFPMPRACGIYYYEIEVLQRGQKGEIGLGFGSSQVSLQRLPGWEQTTRGPVRPRESWGYHGDDGHSFASKDTGERYGPKFTTGDIVGCGVDFTIGRAFYTKNGAFLGHVFENIDGELYPMIGMRSSGEAIRANFGHAPFKYDIESHAHLQRNATWLGIQSKPVAWSHNSIKFETPSVPSSSTQPDSNRTAENDTREAIEKIIMDYLSHHGYAGTAEAFRLSLAARSTTAAALSSSTNSSSSKEIPISDSKVLALSQTADILARQRIEAALLDGKIDVVIDTMGDRYPEALSAEGGWLLFRLRCRKFVELVLEASDAVKAAAKAEPRPSPMSSKVDKGKAPIIPTPTPPASMPIRSALAHSRPTDVFEEEEDEEDADDEGAGGEENAMDIDENDDDIDAADHRAVQDQLLHSPPSPTHFPPSWMPRSPPPASRAALYTTPQRPERPTPPMAISRPLIPISTSSSSSTSPTHSPMSGMSILAVAAESVTAARNASNGVSSRSLAKFASAMPPPSLAPATPAHAPPRIRAFLPSPPQPRGLITDGSSSQPSLFASTSASSSAAQAAMDHIMAFGRQLDADYGADERPRVQSLFQLTVSLVAYVDPRIVGGEVGHLASHEARIELAIAVNEGILASQGRHPRPVLERAYEHTAAMVMHLGLTGTGAAAYADIERELLQEE